MTIQFKDENLRKIIVEASVIHQLDFFTKEDALELKTLVLLKRNIKDITGLEYFKNLDWLDLDDNQITNINPLRDLSKLENIFLRNNKISDYSVLTKIKFKYNCNIYTDMGHYYLPGEKDYFIKVHNVREKNITFTENNINTDLYCNCNGLAKESMDFIGNKFKVCTICRKEKL